MLSGVLLLNFCKNKNIATTITLMFTLLCCLNACTNSKKAKSELQLLRTELANTQKSLNICMQQDSLNITHLVFFTLKPAIKQSEFIAKINELAGIEAIQNMDVGQYKPLNDIRALSSYQVVLKLIFSDETAYQTYQQHPIHLQVKQFTKSMLAAPPATYHYVKNYR